MSQAGTRKASLERKTRETEIRLDLDLDGSGDYDVDTGIPFFDHMLESFAKHGLFDLHLRAKGDLEVDLHHTVEDVGIALGSALREALGDARGIRRYGTQVLPMAEAKVEVSVDVSNRAYLVYRVELSNDRVGGFDAPADQDAGRDEVPDAADVPAQRFLPGQQTSCPGDLPEGRRLRERPGRPPECRRVLQGPHRDFQT